MATEGERVEEWMATNDKEICTSEVSQPRLALQCILAQLSTDCICVVRLSLHMAPRLRLPHLMSHNLCSCTAIEITDWHECSALASHVHRRVEKGVKGFNVRGNKQSEPSESKSAPRSSGNCYCRTVVFTAMQMFGHDSLSCRVC